MAVAKRITDNSFDLSRRSAIFTERSRMSAERSTALRACRLCLVSSSSERTSESGREAELKHPAASRPLEWACEIELADRNAEQVHAKCDSRTGDAVVPVERVRLLRHAEDRGRNGGQLEAVPGEAAVREQGDFDGHRAVHPLSRAERAQQREAE